MKKINKKDTNQLFRIIGEHVTRYNTLLIVFLSLLILINVAFTLGWYYSPDDVSNINEILFYVSQSVLFLVTLGAIAFLIVIRFKKINVYLIAILNHAYAAFLIAWSTVALCLDLTLGFSPFIYLIISIFVAGVFVIEPIFFAIIETLSFIPIIITIILNPDLFFGDRYYGENIALFVTFVILIIFVCFRNYRVIYAEHHIKKKLSELSYKDELTGLLNERSYVKEVENINQRIKNGEEVKFAVLLMDVNNLKATNDAYGHRYGCSLVVRCGQTLPKLLPTSKLFHVGGDEFIAIVEGRDYDNFEETMKRFDAAMLYSVVEYEGQKLIFSVARGYHMRENEQYYKDVLQIADEAMYENKKYLKEKYHMKGR